MTDVDAVDLDGAARALDDPEEGEGEGGLAGPRAPHDPDLLHALHVTVDAPQHQVQTLSVPCLKYKNLDPQCLMNIMNQVLTKDCHVMRLSL